MPAFKKLFSYILAPAALAMCVGVNGCSAEDEGPMFVEVGPPTTVIPSEETDGLDTDSMEELACTPHELCSETIDRCEVNMPIENCEWWYEDEANCADLNGYVNCNCDCLAEDTCDDYFACGQFCFDEFC